MPATTASGWPYILPADHPVEYPTTSQAVASKLEADVTVGKRSTWTASAGYTASGGLLVTRVGPLVVVEGAVAFNAGGSLTAGSMWAFGTVPVGYRPAQAVNTVCTHDLNGYAVGVPAYLGIATTGILTLGVITAGTIATNGKIWFAAAYRGA